MKLSQMAVKNSRFCQKLEELNQENPTLRVMDTKTAEILERLRKYFYVIPEFRHMPRIKVGTKRKQNNYRLVLFPKTMQKKIKIQMKMT